VATDGQDRGKYIVEALRIQGDDLGRAAQMVQRLLHVAGGERAHATQVLSEDQLRGQRGQRAGVQRVEILALGELITDVGVDRGRAHPRGIAPADNYRFVPAGLGWFVAFERNPDQLITEAEGVHDLGRRRKQ
jgi:hypothetical protein